MSEFSERQRAIRRVELIDRLGLNEEVQNVFFAERVKVLEDKSFSLQEIKNILAEKEGWNPADLQVLDIWLSEEDGTITEVTLDVKPEKAMEKEGKEVTYFFHLKSEATYSRSQKSKTPIDIKERTEIDKNYFMGEVEENDDEADLVAGDFEAEQHVYTWVYKAGKWEKEA